MPFTENERQVLYQEVEKALLHQINEALHGAGMIPNEIYQTVQRNLDDTKERGV